MSPYRTVSQTVSGGTSSWITLRGHFQTPSTRVVVGGYEVERRPPGETDLNDGVSEVTVLSDEVLVVPPVLDVDDRRLILGPKPP